MRQSKFFIRHCLDPHDATGRFDFVLANPPFNVNTVDKEAEGLIDELLKGNK